MMKRVAGNVKPENTGKVMNDYQDDLEADIILTDRFIYGSEFIFLLA
ncbi:MAG TPA: hypothetical protein VMX13_12505 [Sedimentisphaerales bacterium]|nr:hypothetical protein [Sedimentisphaerales bacterium]